ncbi:MAG: hypothetical protein Q9191_004162 [Dirinaria sp. TL-2023a]
MIFVCHCYGGLVVLQALLAARNTTQEWPEIFDWTTGLVFFGTPFRGARRMNLVEMLEAARLKYSSEQIQEETLRVLQSGNETLLNLVHDFCQVRQDKRVMCFYETRTTSVGKIFGRQDVTDYLVDQSSGCLDPDPSSFIRSLPLTRDHFDMNKFAGPEDDDFMQVKEVIADMVKEAPNLVQRHSHRTTSEQPQGNIGINMTFRGKEDAGNDGRGVERPLLFQWNIPRSSSGSFVGRTDVVNEIKNKLSEGNTESQKRYVITGIGGIGKSEICLRVIDKMRSKVGAEKSLVDLAESRELHASDLNSARNALASIPGNHLVVLDNADDPNEDYQGFAPPANDWSVIITSRNIQCSRHSSVGHWSLQSLDTGESSRLLLQAAEIPEDDWPAKATLATKVVDCLGSHTLALIQAGSYIRAKRCTLSEYPEIFEKKSQKLLEFNVTQQGSRYSNVWTTFEVTATAFEKPQKANTDAKCLLDTLSMLHFTNFPTEVFEHTWREARQIVKRGLEATNSRDTPKVLFEGLSHIARTRSLGAGKDYLQQVYAQEVFRLLADQVSDFLPILSDEWESDRIHDALDILTDLSLVQKSETKDGKLTISMHKLTHSWARERMDDPQTKRQAWLRAGSTIVLSNMTSWIWADPEIQLRPHARYFADNSRSFDISGVPPDMAEKIVLFCAELLQILREDEMLEQFLDKIIQELQKHGKSIMEVSLPLCKVKAKNLYDLSRLDEAIAWWTNIVEAEKKRITTRRPDRLESQHQLTRAMFLQGQNDSATTLLQKVVKECQERLGEEHPVRLAAEHDFADFCGLQGDTKKAIELFTHVVNVRRRICKETQPELLITQHQLARTYLHDGQLDEAFARFHRVLKIREANLPETHPERLATEHELGCCYRESGEYDKAIESLEKVVKIRKQTLAPDNIEGLLSQQELALTYMYDDQIVKAIEILTHVVDMQKHLLESSSNRRNAEFLLSICKEKEDDRQDPATPH